MIVKKIIKFWFFFLILKVETAFSFKNNKFEKRKKINGRKKKSSLAVISGSVETWLHFFPLYKMNNKCYGIFSPFFADGVGWAMKVEFKFA